MHQNKDPFLQGSAMERKHMAWVAGAPVLSVLSPVPPEQAVEPVTKLAALQSLHILSGTEHGKNWGGE